MLTPNGVISTSNDSTSLISAVESLTPSSSNSNNNNNNITLNHELPLINSIESRSRSSSFYSLTSSSPNLITTNNNNNNNNSINSITNSINTISPQSSRIFASRPSPVVPSSVPASPSFSRPTSPGPNHQNQNNNNKNNSILPNSSSTTSPPSSNVNNDLNNSNPNLIGSHIFERDVEFPSRHQISPSEAVDVAIPAVLDEAAIAITNSDDLTSSEFNNYIKESEELGSGWSSPVPPNYSPPLPSTNSSSGRNRLSSQGFDLINYSNNNTSRSLSPDRINNSRGVSPNSIEGNSNNTTFNISTPSPLNNNNNNNEDNTFHPFIQHLSEALEEEANAAKGGLNSSINTNSCVTEAKSITNSPLLFPTTTTTSTSSTPNPFSSESSPSIGTLFLPPSNSNSNSSSTQSIPTISGLNSFIGGIGIDNSINLENLPTLPINTSTMIRNPRLSFTSYADILNEERLGEMLGNPREG